jgi:hypothetical protein
VGSALHVDLADLSDDQLIDLGVEIDRTLCAIFKIDSVKPTLPIEVKMSKQLTRAWKAAVRKGMTAPLKRLLSGSPTQRKIDNFVRALGVKLAKPLTAAQIKSLESRLKKIYQIAKDIGAKEAKVSAFSFNQVDLRAVRALNKHQVFWVGDFYTAQLSDRIKAVSADVLIERGFSQSEAAKTLRRALKQEFGLLAGGRSEFAPSIPARFAGNPDLYFRGLASTASHQSRTFGKVAAYEEAEILRYRLVNPNDRRTGQICQQMHGQVFTVQTAARHVERIVSAEKPEDVKEIAPWLSGKKLEETIDGAKRGGKTASERLEAAGAILPPFHMLCRTEPVVIA